ncbi:hypothetical protein D3C80_1399590 [compost metagenome]
MPDITVEVRRLLRANAHGFTRLEHNAHPPAEHQGKFLPRVADEFIELLPLAGDDPRIHWRHQPLGKFPGDRVVVVGPSAVAGRRGQGVDHHRGRHRHIAHA